MVTIDDLTLSLCTVNTQVTYVWSPYYMLPNIYYLLWEEIIILVVIIILAYKYGFFSYIIL